MEKKEFFFRMGLEDHYFQEALGYEVDLEGKVTSQNSEKNHFGGKAERMGSLMVPETGLTVYLEAE